MLAITENALGVDVCRNLSELASLRREWRALCDACPSTTPFQRPEWLLSWCETFAPARPYALVVRRAGRLVGLAPFFVWDDSGTPTLALLGAGHSDYLDIAAHEAYASAVLEAIAQQLERDRKDFTVCSFHDLRPNALLGRMRRLAGYRDHRSAETTCPQLRIGKDVRSLEDIVPTLPILRRFRRDWTRALRRSRVELELATDSSLLTLAASFNRLHGARWQDAGGGMLTDPRCVRMHALAMQRMLEAGHLRLYALRVAGDIVATLYGMRLRDTLYCYLQGIDPAYAKLSPGVLLLGAVIQHAITEGCATVDLLRGAEPYKYAWGAQDLWTERRTLTREPVG